VKYGFIYFYSKPKTIEQICDQICPGQHRPLTVFQHSKAVGCQTAMRVSSISSENVLTFLWGSRSSI